MTCEDCMPFSLWVGLKGVCSIQVMGLVAHTQQLHGLYLFSKDGQNDK